MKGARHFREAGMRLPRKAKQDIQSRGGATIQGSLIAKTDAASLERFSSDYLHVAA
jgi:hypothetical protein